MVDRFSVHQEIDDADIGVRGQSPIELNLTVAVRLASGPLPKVQKSESYGLSELVDPIANEEERRNVSLDDPNSARIGGLVVNHHGFSMIDDGRGGYQGQKTLFPCVGVGLPGIGRD